MPQGDVLQLKAGTGDLGLVNSFLDGRELVNKKTRFTRSQQIKTEAYYLAASTVETASDDFWKIRFAKYKVEGENIRHGEWKTCHPNGKLHMRGQYYRDQKVDHFVYWHSNGQGEYRNDNYEGEWVWWHPNGQKAVTGSFRNGALIDQWRWWDEVGRLTKQVRHDGSKTILSHEDAELELGLQEHIPWPIKR